MRVFLCKVLVVLLLLSSHQTASALVQDIGKSLDKVFKVAGVTIVGTGLVGLALFTGVQAAVQVRALRNPDFLQMRDGGMAVNHYSNISRYDVEEKDPSVRDYLEIADKQDIELTLHLRDDKGNSSIATFIDLDGNTVAVKRTTADGNGVFEVPLTQVSGVALYEPDIYGHYAAVGKDKLTLLYAEDTAELSYFSKYHALVLASFSDNFQLLRIIAAIDGGDGDTVDNDRWLISYDRGIDAMVRNIDVVYRTPSLK